MAPSSLKIMEEAVSDHPDRCDRDCDGVGPFGVEGSSAERHTRLAWPSAELLDDARWNAFLFIRL